jgi:hypothetical protein
MSTVNTGFDVNVAQALDTKYGKLSSGKTVPYTSVAEANAALTPSFRYAGKTCLIDDGTGIDEYWYYGGIADGNLVPKVRKVKPLEIIIGAGAGYTVSTDKLTLTVTALQNKEILDFFIESQKTPLIVRTGSTYGTFTPSAGTILLTNGTFANDAYISISYR